MNTARLFFRVIEQVDGTWACRHGRHEIDRHGTQDEAIVHATGLAGKQRPSRIYLHDVHGKVTLITTLD